MNYSKVIIFSLFFITLALWNTTLLYDRNVSVDFSVYQGIWENTGLSAPPVEFIFTNTGYLLPNLDFRVFFSVLNLLILFKLCYRYSNGILLVLLTSPFTVLGFGNTVLSFSAGLIWLVLIKTSPNISLLVPISLHKAGLFVSVFTRPVMMSFLVVGLAVGRQYIPTDLTATLLTFEEPLSQIIIKIIICLLPFVSIFLKLRIFSTRAFIEISLILTLIFVTFTISSKVADRIAYMVFFYGLYRGDFMFRELRLKSLVLVLFFLIPVNITLIFLSGAYEHLPYFLQL